VDSLSGLVVHIARPPTERFRSRRLKEVFAEEVLVVEDLPGALIEEVLIDDARARLTPSDMVERKLIDALSSKFRDCKE